MLIRPTMKFITLGYIVALLMVAGVSAITAEKQLPWWVPFGAAVLFLAWPLEHHMRRQASKILILDDRLRYERGFLGKTTRTILISKIQDITVHQTLGQRFFGVGDLSIETAGEASGLTLQDIDGPQRIADHINGLSERQGLPVREVPKGQST